MNSKPKIGVSACLLGSPVRFNGEHKRNEWITTTLARHVNLIGFCPETSMGLPTPRPALRFIDSEAGVRLVESNSKTDLTEKAIESNRVLALQADDFDGFILKKDSPSCGLERVKIYGKGGIPRRSEMGLFARALKERFPLMPMIEEGRLNDLAQRDNFVLRVFAYSEAKALMATGEKLKASQIQIFHRKYKFILLEHSPTIYRSLGKLIGNQDKKEADEILKVYLPLFMTALAKSPTIGSRVNVLQHILGYLKSGAGREERAQLVEAIHQFQMGELPFIAPLALLYHEVRKHKISYALAQKFFAPFPRELGGQVRL